MKILKYGSVFSIILLVMRISFCEEYLVICHEDLFNSDWYHKLSLLKTDQGFSVIYLEINDGDNVGTIRAAIEYFNPEYVLLIGDASDYPDSCKQSVSASNGNYIPFCYTSMYCSSHPNNESDPIPNDEWFIENSTGTCIGRIPAKSASEVEIWIDKLVEEFSSYSKYEDWKNDILFITGNIDHPSNGCRGIYREMERDTLIARYIENTDMDYTTLNSADYGPGYLENQSARAMDFENAVNAGCSFINAIGVGADDYFLVNFYFADSDYNFSNTGKYPFLLGMSGYVGRIQRYSDGENVEAVIQKLMFLQDAGIMNCIAPTWAVVTSGVRDFCYVAFANFFQNEYQNLGKALKQIKSEFVITRPDCDWMSKAIVLYGDPAAPLPVYQYVRANIDKDTKWNGSIIVENDISVAENANLAIQAGTGIFFKNNARLSVHGTFDAIGTATYPIKFSAAKSSPATGNWDGIRLYSGSAADLRYCEIEYAQNGICINGSDPVIADCFIHDNSHYGIFISSGSEPTLKDNTITGNGSAGIYCSDYSESIFGTVAGNGFNRIIDNDHGIIASHNSTAELGYFIGSGYICAYNSIFNNTHEDAKAVSGATIVAHACWWGTPNPDPAQFYIGNGGDFSKGTIYHQYELASDPGGGSTLTKSKGNSHTDDWISPGYIDIDDPEYLWKTALDQRYKDNIECAVEINKDIINRFPSSEFAIKALCQVFHISKMNDIEGLLSYLQHLKSLQLPVEIWGTVLDLLILKNIGDRDYEEAEELCQEMLVEFPNSRHELFSLYQLVLMYSDIFANSDTAGEYLNRLKVKYPDSELTLMAREVMGEEVDWSLLNESVIHGRGNGAGLIPDEFALRNNYPNPFNPSTIIEYDLPEDSKVTLIVYDVIGREVIRLVDSTRPGGYYKAIWDGQDKSGHLVSSGVYIYRIQAGGFTKTSKMVFIR